ncbi:MAG: ribonuclease HII [Candidatus Babeliales bacterium]
MKKRPKYQKFSKNFYEKRAWSENRLIIGVDEVGRSCTAGPVVAGAVILKGKSSPQLKDSKILTPGQRENAYTWLSKNSWAAVGIVSPDIIDEINIYWASMLAMRYAVLNVLAICPHPITEIVIDAMPLKLTDTAHKDISIYHFPFGESQSSSIAAASIWAKVTRDSLMQKMNLAFPGYRLDKHKGYNTPEHQTYVKASGHSIIHRYRFLQNVGLVGHNNEFKQQNLFIPAQSEQ